MDFSKVPPDKMAVLTAKFFARGPAVMFRAKPVEDMIAPVREVMVGDTILRYHPTQLPIARWAIENPRAMEQSLDNFSFDVFDIIPISEEFDIRKIDLKPSPLFPQFGKVLATDDVVGKIAQEIPVDDTEIVEWMHDVTAANVVTTAREAEYNEHSQFIVRDGDPNIPGVRTSSLAYRRVSGYTYRRQGYATAVGPIGSIRVPANSLIPLIGKDFLGWAFAGKSYACQWHGALAEFMRLANSITRPVGFPNIEGFVAPFFVLQQPDKQAQRVRVRMVFDSDRDQRVNITFRDPSDYRRTIDEGWIDIPKGTSTVEFVVASYPSVPPVVNHMQPKNGTRTVLNRFEVRR